MILPFSSLAHASSHIDLSYTQHLKMLHRRLVMQKRNMKNMYSNITVP